jgi:hypothetical protein
MIMGIVNRSGDRDPRRGARQYTSLGREPAVSADPPHYGFVI